MAGSLFRAHGSKLPAHRVLHPAPHLLWTHDSVAVDCGDVGEGDIGGVLVETMVIGQVIVDDDEIG